MRRRTADFLQGETKLVAKELLTDHRQFSIALDQRMKRGRGRQRVVELSEFKDSVLVNKMLCQC
jgi:hypothetical protein